jgi:predicted transcriptional regulator of viral defense system
VRRDDEWTRKWRNVPVEQRRRIVRSVARGEAVADPRDAPLALEVIDRREQKLQSARRGWFSRWLSGRHLVVLAAIGLVAALVFRDFLVIGLTLLTALYVVGFRLFLRRLEASIVEARRKNEQLAQL